MKKGKYVLIIFLIFLLLIVITAATFFYYMVGRPPAVKAHSYLELNYQEKLQKELFLIFLLYFLDRNHFLCTICG